MATYWAHRYRPSARVHSILHHIDGHLYAPIGIYGYTLAHNIDIKYPRNHHEGQGRRQSRTELLQKSHFGCILVRKSPIRGKGAWGCEGKPPGVYWGRKRGGRHMSIREDRAMWVFKCEKCGQEVISATTVLHPACPHCRGTLRATSSEPPPPYPDWPTYMDDFKRKQMNKWWDEHCPPEG